jgi:type VI secretion system protein ImpF
MARHRPASPVLQSVLDRLIDWEPKVSAEAPPTRAESIRQLKSNLRQDLERLLNTRRAVMLQNDRLREVQHSIYMFGLPDLASYALANPKDRDRLVRALQAAIRTFEPRITNVRIVPLEQTGAGRHMLQFRIEGMLRMDPAPEPISFDTVLHFTSGEYQVKGESDA